MHHGCKKDYWPCVLCRNSSEIYVKQILQPFFKQLTNAEKFYGYFQQESATAHTTKHYMQILNRVVGKSVIIHGMWPAHSLDINLCHFFLWGYLKNKVY
jgi:hypothetical protein